jgi:hypothetical protein
MNYINITSPADIVCTDADRPHDPRLLLASITAILYSVSVILSAVTLCTRRKRDAVTPPPSPTSDHWQAVGLYDLRKPQTLTKVEREAAAQHDGTNAILYEREYPSGTRAWRYSLDGYEWFYPTRSAVIRRGRTSEGDLLLHAQED